MLVTLDLAEPDFFHSTAAYISSTTACMLSLARYRLTKEESTPTLYFQSGSTCPLGKRPREHCSGLAMAHLLAEVTLSSRPSTVAALILFLLKTNQNRISEYI